MLRGWRLQTPSFPRVSSPSPSKAKGTCMHSSHPQPTALAKDSHNEQGLQWAACKGLKDAPWPTLIYTARHSTKKCNSRCLKTISASLSAAKGTNKTVGFYPHSADEQLRATTEPRDGFCTFQVRQIQTASSRLWLCICCQPFNTGQQEQGLEAPYRNYKSCCQLQQSFRDALTWHMGWQLWDVTKKLRHETTTQSLSLGKVSPVFAAFLPRDFQHFVLDKKIQKNAVTVVSLSCFPPPLIFQTVELNDFCILPTSYKLPQQLSEVFHAR